MKKKTFCFSGNHIICDFYSVADNYINNHTLLIKLLTDAINKAGATIIDTKYILFYPTGLSAIILLSESHVSIHTYPEHNALFFDAFTCGKNCDPKSIVDDFAKGIEVPLYNIHMIHIKRGQS